MRLQEQLTRLQTSLKMISYKPQVAGAFQIIQDVPTILSGIKSIEMLPYLKNEIEAIKQIQEFFLYSSVEISLENNKFNKLNSNITKLINKIKIVADILNFLIPGEEALSISIKLPKHHGLKKIADDLAKLDQIINQIITLPGIEGGYSFTNFDVGTEWVTILVNSTMSYGLLAAVAWSAAVVRKKKIEGDILLEDVKSKNIKTETLEDLKKALNVELDSLVQGEAGNIAFENNIDKKTRNEDFLRIAKCIKMLSELIMKGAEVHPALMAKEEAKNLFPDFSNLLSIESKTKLLEEDKGSE